MKKIICSLTVFLGLSFLISAQEFSNPKKYGDCVTITMFDPMSDESGAIIFCGSDPTLFSIIQEAANLDLYIGIQTIETKIVADTYSFVELQQFEDSEVKLRVDREEILIGYGSFLIDGFFYIRDHSLAEILLKKITEGQKLYISIDDNLTFTISLAGAREAVRDMRKRLGE